MTNEEFHKLAVTAAVEVAKDRSEDLYNDGARGAVRETGESLQALVGLFNNVVLYPIKKANINYRYKLEEFEKDLKAKTDKIPDGKIIEPPLAISGPTIEALKYTFDTKEIREMFLNLLASAMNSDFKDESHPAFVEIIKGMNSLDATLFEYLYSSVQIPVGALRIGNTENYFTTALPYIFSQELIKHGDPFLVSRSMVNLERLGLIQIIKDRYFPNYDYDALKNHEYIAQRFMSYNNLNTMAALEVMFLFKGYLELTDLGKSLSKCCFLLK
jgi:hypothetical protein